MIPKKPLELHEIRNLTLGEMAMFSPGELTEFEFVLAMRKFLIYHTNWTPVEIDGIRTDELMTVGKSLIETMKKVAVPKGTRTRSKIGRVKKATAESPLGSTS